MKIGIWRDQVRTDRFYYMSESPSTWNADGKQIDIPANKSLYFTYKNDRVRLSTVDQAYGLFNNVKSQESSNFKLVSLMPVRTIEIYNEHLVVSVGHYGLKVINAFKDIENYISGVVEAETGKEQNKEFYKVQSTISRTLP